MKTEFVRARIEPHLKAEVHEVFEKLGITPTQAITMFYKLIEREQGLPFNVSLPNRDTVQAIEEARKRKGVVVCKNSEDLFNKLGM